MIITKSLFREFATCPMLAWRHRHDTDVYKRINKKRYGGVDAAAIGKEVEDITMQLFANKTILTPDTSILEQGRWYQGYHEQTLQLVQQSPDVIYQPGFFVDGSFCIADFMVRNNQGTYDLWEVKSKTAIRKKTKAAPLSDEIALDVQFQHYVIQQAWKEKYSTQAFVVYLNKEYIKKGPIYAKEILTIEDISNDVLDTSSTEAILDTIKSKLSLNKQDFQSIYPYSGEQYLLYFGKKNPPGSIFTIPRITQSKKKLAALYHNGKHTINDLTADDCDFLLGDKPTNSFIDYIQRYKQGKHINKEAIQKIFDEKLQYPLYFYDYETISSPVPYFENTTPWQQVIVQYSIHIVQEDGTVEHREGIRNKDDFGESNDRNNKALIAKLIQDLVPDEKGTYIVRYKGFENSRNKETALLFPMWEQQFHHINENTLDLMDIFKEWHYFDPAFQGSSSIKKVLPVLTNIRYDSLAINNGGQAAQELRMLINGQYKQEKAEKTRKALLEYCHLDTRAMVVIWQKICQVIQYPCPIKQKR